MKGDIVVHGDDGDYTLTRAKAGDRAKISELKAAAVRLRNFGAPVERIADVLRIDPDAAESLLTTALRELTAESAAEVRARQQATINDMRRALYPAIQAGDIPASGTMLRVLDHEATLHGIKAPQRIAVGLDQESFTTTAAEDMRALGVDPGGPVIEADEPDEGWANT